MKSNFLFVLVDRQHGHFYQFQGASRTLTHLSELSEEVPKPVKAASWKGLADDKVARHIEDHIRDHLKNVVQKLDQLVKDDPMAAIILGGPEEVVTQFQGVLPSPLGEKVIATLHPDHHASLKELEELLTQAVDRYRLAMLANLVKEVENDRGLSGRGIVGREAVCEALNLKQVHMLLLHPTTAYAGAYCPADGSVAAISSQCPACLAKLTETPDLSQHLKSLAERQDAEIVEVADATLFPADAEHIAALRRF